eukprot:6308143-Amphidinium_carterae.1
MMVRAKRRRFPEHKLPGPDPWTPPWHDTTQVDPWSRWLDWSSQAEQHLQTIHGMSLSRTDLRRGSGLKLSQQRVGQ